MLPLGSGKGQLWRNGRFLCDVAYEIDGLLTHTGRHNVQRITFTVEEQDCLPLLRSSGFTLVLADGSKHSIPRPLKQIQPDKLECYIESPQSGAP